MPINANGNPTIGDFLYSQLTPSMNPEKGSQIKVMVHVYMNPMGGIAMIRPRQKVVITSGINRRNLTTVNRLLRIMLISNISPLTPTLSLREVWRLYRRPPG